MFFLNRYFRKGQQIKVWVIIVSGLACIGIGLVMAETRDPTQPQQMLLQFDSSNGDKDLDKVKDLELSAIFISKERKIAVINGMLVKEGDVIGGKKIDSISRKKVILTTKEETLELRLPEQVIKGLDNEN